MQECRTVDLKITHYKKENIFCEGLMAKLSLLSFWIECERDFEEKKLFLDIFSEGVLRM